MQKFHWEFEQEKVRRREDRKEDQTKNSQMHDETIRKQLGHQATHEMSLKTYISLQSQEKEKEFSTLKRDIEAEVHDLSRRVVREKNDRIQMVGETRGVIEDQMTSNEERLSTELSQFKSDQDERNQEIASRVDGLTDRQQTVNKRVSKDCKKLREAVNECVKRPGRVRNIDNVGMNIPPLPSSKAAGTDEEITP